MKKVIVQTVTGRYRKDLIKELARVSREFDGEWLNTKLIRLHHQFTAMMMISIDEEKEAALKSSMAAHFPDLHFSYATVEADAGAQAEVATVVIDCKDRPGLTHDITKILSYLNLTAESMEFHRLPVTPVGGTVYTARMKVEFPDEASKEALVERIESISDCSHINFE